MLSRAQINKSITSLNLRWNSLDAEAGKALGAALEVTFPFSVSALSHNDEINFLRFLSMMQVNKTITELNLKNNELGPEGGKAIATSLQVTFPFLLLALSI